MNHEEWKSAVVAMNKRSVSPKPLFNYWIDPKTPEASTFRGIDRGRSLVQSLKKAGEDESALKAITFAIEWISLYEDVEGWFPSASYRDELAKSIYKAFKETK